VFERSLQRHLAASKKSVLLLGPRQVGKSTLAATLAPDLTLNFAHPATYREYVAQPERLERELAALGRGAHTVFLDEVQRVPALLDLVQVLLDAKRNTTRFLLSGSSARKLRRGQANLLPGRIHVHHLHPLLACEIGDDFDLDTLLAVGSLPGILSESDPAERARDLTAYADIYLREEVQAEALVRDIGGYARLLDLVAAASGSVLNVQKLCKDAALSYETARRYVEVLEDTLLVFRVPAWSGSTRARLVAHPRLYLFDLGVRNALLRRPLDRPLEDERGLLFEHFIACELERRRGTLWPELELSYLRTSTGVEIDFVARHGRETWAIEVKATRSPRPADFKHLARASEYFGARTRPILVHLGDRAQRHDGIEALPLREFLAELPT
jgi:predicted AAA+ superfamily ATPase